MFNFANAVYESKRQPGEPNLVELVRGLLLESCTAEEVAEKFDNHPLVSSCTYSNSSVQKVNLFRYWTMQLMGVPNSQTARLNLSPGPDNAIWFKQFHEVVLPFCLSNNGFRKIH